MSQFTPNSQLKEWFGFHPANTADKQAAHETVRATYYALAVEMNALLPEGPDKTLALRTLQSAAMHANACLAINGGPDPDYDFGRAHLGAGIVAFLEDTYPGFSL